MSLYNSVASAEPSGNIGESKAGDQGWQPIMQKYD